LKLLIRDIEVEISNFTRSDYEVIQTIIRRDLANSKVKNREVIQNAFMEAVKIAPQANPSDLWHHIIYRLYRNNISAYRELDDAAQSWKRASGDAFEFFFVNYYNVLLTKTDIRLIALAKKEKVKALELMGIHRKVGDSKLDVAIIAGCIGGACPSLETGIIGGVHMKVSLAERISDDVPCSKAMMEKGYLSLLATLDVKSFPLSSTISEKRAYINNGELGTAKKPTDKRRHIEEIGDFDACFSYNLRTVASAKTTASKKKIFVGRFNRNWDSFCKTLVAARKRIYGRIGT